MENAISIYESLARPPKDALREIKGGKLTGKTDINPQWRYKAMTEKFGLVGIGWKYKIQKLWAEQGAGAEVLAFAKVAVLIKSGDNWSDPIVGIGGSKLIAIEKGSPVSNDEGYKMAVTDALGTALKMLGVAADIYAGRWDGTKYKETPAKPAFEPKGGEATPIEKKAITVLLNQKDSSGTLFFSKNEIARYSNMRKDKTAAEIIELIKEDLRNRLSVISPDEVGIPTKEL